MFFHRPCFPLVPAELAIADGAGNAKINTFLGNYLYVRRPAITARSRDKALAQYDKLDDLSDAGAHQFLDDSSIEIKVQNDNGVAAGPRVRALGAFDLLVSKISDAALTGPTRW